MADLDRLNDRQRVLLVAGAADLHPITAGHFLDGKPVSRKTRIALERARANLDAIRDELGAALDRRASNDTASTAGAAASASMPGGARRLAMRDVSRAEHEHERGSWPAGAPIKATEDTPREPNEAPVAEQDQDEEPIEELAERLG